METRRARLLERLALVCTEYERWYIFYFYVLGLLRTKLNVGWRYGVSVAIASPAIADSRRWLWTFFQVTRNPYYDWHAGPRGSYYSKTNRSRLASDDSKPSHRTLTMLLKLILSVNNAVLVYSHDIYYRSRITCSLQCLHAMLPNFRGKNYHTMQ